MNESRVERRLPASPRRLFWPGVVVAVGLVLGAALLPAAELTPAARGRNLLLSQPYLPADFDQQVFDELWTTWEEPARSEAEQAPLARRRIMAMQRYGLTPYPDDPSRSTQYVVDALGTWTMSCLACHQGQVNGQAIPGVPNSNYAIETLTEEVRLVKLRQRKPFGHMDIGSLFLPLGTTNGTTNAVMFGVALMRHRDPDLTIVQRPPRLDLIHHDMDAPAWWHYKKRRSLYADGFAPKGHRMLMQFLLVKENGPERFHAWEEGFRDIEHWIESLESPVWQWPIDAILAEQGRSLFNQHCADCHGTYGKDAVYPERIVDIAEVGTDRVRFDSLTSKERGDLNKSWFGHFDAGWGAEAAAMKDRVAPRGYVAPPLDGLWATAPYFHNGSVPTLWHVLHPATRPVVWKRSNTGYDQTKVGLEVEAMESLPKKKLSSAERHRHFDTTKRGKSAAGHDFPDVLEDTEKAAVLEYLKTL